MSSQFEKRKAKAEAAIKEKRAEIRGDEAPTAVETPIEVPVVATQATKYTHEGFDIFLSADGRKYHVVTFQYNPETLEVSVKRVDPIQRQVGLSYENQKRALRTLLRNK